jgi:hypothetical protein
MFRFSVRELMLVTLVVGLALGWGVDRAKLSALCAKLVGQCEQRKHWLSELGVTVEPDFVGDGEHITMPGSKIEHLPDSPYKRRAIAAIAAHRHMAAMNAKAADQPDSPASPSP